jgi:MFS family permease
MTAEGSTVPGPPPFDRRSTSPWTRGRRGITAGMVGLIGLTAFEALAVTTAMPVVVDALGGLELYAMAFAAPAAASILGVVAAGSWADRSGPRSPLLAGVAAFVVGLVIAGTATGMAVVVAGRAMQGLGAGALVVALYVVVAQVFPATVQPRVFAAFAAAWVVPSMVGPAAAGWLAEHVGWRWVFLAVPILAVPAMATLRPVLTGGTRPPADHVRPPGERGRLLRGLGAGVAALSLHWGGQQDVAVAAVTAVVGLTLLAVTVPGLLPRGTFRFRRGLPSVVMLRGVFGTAFFAAEVYLPLLLTSERGLRPGQAGLVLTVAAITWSVGSWLRGRSEGRWSDAGLLRVGALALVLGIASVALAVWSAVPVLTPMLGWGLSGFGMGLAYPTTSLLIIRLSEPHEIGANSAALQVNEALCIAVALAASGPAFAQIIRASASAAFLTVLALPIALALVAALAASRVTTPHAAT